ncbi:MAG TPA: DUF2303 family protein [Methylomirabilota bacterium]|nr:DUF2303 family protein [Methylomirabilota bacterium]
MDTPQNQTPAFPLDEALAIGAALGDPHAPEANENAIPYAIVPAGYQFQSLEHLLAAPRRVRAAVAVPEVNSFIRYVNEFKCEDTRIYIDVDNKRVEAVIDHPAKGKPSWACHRVVLAVSHSPEFDAWKKASGTAFTQTHFAEFIEDRMNEFVRPAAAEIYEVATTLQVSERVEFKRAIRLDNGASKLIFNKASEATAGDNESVEVPKIFELGIPVFRGEEPRSITCKLRYRLNDGAVTFSYHIVDLPKIIQTAFEFLATDIETQTGITPLNGIFKINP